MLVKIRWGVFVRNTEISGVPPSSPRCHVNSMYNHVQVEVQSIKVFEQLVAQKMPSHALLDGAAVEERRLQSQFIKAILDEGQYYTFQQDDGASCHFQLVAKDPHRKKYIQSIARLSEDVWKGHMGISILQPACGDGMTFAGDDNILGTIDVHQFYDSGSYKDLELLQIKASVEFELPHSLLDNDPSDIVEGHGVIVPANISHDSVTKIGNAILHGGGDLENPPGMTTSQLQSSLGCSPNVREIAEWMASTDMIVAINDETDPHWQVAMDFVKSTIRVAQRTLVSEIRSALPLSSLCTLELRNRLEEDGWTFESTNESCSIASRVMKRFGSASYFTVLLHDLVGCLDDEYLSHSTSAPSGYFQCVSVMLDKHDVDFQSDHDVWIPKRQTAEFYAQLLKWLKNELQDDPRDALCDQPPQRKTKPLALAAVGHGEVANPKAKACANRNLVGLQAQRLPSLTERRYYGRNVLGLTHRVDDSDCPDRCATVLYFDKDGEPSHWKGYVDINMAGRTTSANISAHCVQGCDHFAAGCSARQEVLRRLPQKMKAVDEM